MNYDIQLDLAIGICMSGDFSKGEKIANEIINKYGWVERGVHLLLCIYSCTSQNDKAISMLNKLVQEAVWLNPVELEEDNDLNTIRDLAEFKKFHQLCWDMYNHVTENLKSEIHVIGEKSDEAAPVYFFHGRGAKLEEFSADFKEIFEGKQVYYVQSDQVYSAGRYCWDNEELASKQIDDVLDQASGLQKLVCGVSQGARILTNAFANGKIKDDMLLFIPAVSERDVQMVRNANIEYKGKITIVSGDKDACFSATMELTEVLKEKGYNVSAHVINGMGHYILSDEIKEKLILDRF